MSQATTAAPGTAARGRAGRGRKVNTFPLLAPSVAALLVWMIVPLVLTLWYSLQRYNLLYPERRGFVGLQNYVYILSDSTLQTAILNTIVLTGAVLLLSVVFGTLLAVLLNQEFWGQNLARVLVIAPFFVMPPVAALIWKTMMMNPIQGVIAWVTQSLGLGAISWFQNWPMLSIIIIVAWQWIPFATLILLTAMQSLDHEQMEAARMDGAGAISRFRYVVIPHLSRPITIVIMMETIFLLSVFAEILVTTSGGPGHATTTLTYLIYIRALLSFNIGGASAAGVIAIVLANIVAVFLMRIVAGTLERR